MKRTHQSMAVCCLVSVLMSASVLADGVPDSLTLFDFEEGFELQSAYPDDAKASLIDEEGSRKLLRPEKTRQVESNILASSCYRL